MRSNLDDVRIRNSRQGKGQYMESADFAPATGFVLTIDHPPLLILNPAGAVNILMPTSNLARKGLMFYVLNPSAFTITFQTDGGAAFTTAMALTTTQNCILICTGSTTQALGWRKIPATAV